MSTGTADKKNEELGKDVPVSSKDIEQEKPTNAQAKASGSATSEEPKSIPSANETSLAETMIVSDVNSVKLLSTPGRDLLSSLSLDTGAVTGSAEPGIQPPANLQAKAHEVPDTKEDTAAVAEHIVSVNPDPLADSKVDARISCMVEVHTESTAEAPADSMAETPADSKVQDLKSSGPEGPADSRVEISRLSKAEPHADSKTELPADSKVKPSPKPNAASSGIEIDNVSVRELKNEVQKTEFATPAANEKSNIRQPTPPKPNAASSDIGIKNVNVRELKNEVKKTEFATPTTNEKSNTGHLFLLDGDYEGSESGTEEEQSTFMKDLENFFRERSMEFKPPKFYGEGLNCLKLWRAVTRLGGYDKVTSCKLWRQVGESFKPPKVKDLPGVRYHIVRGALDVFRAKDRQQGLSSVLTCTTVSWTFRGFYEKALLDYERHKISGGELCLPVVSQSEPMNIDNQASGSGRARRDAAARAMQGWHSQRVLGNGEVTDPIIKDKNSVSPQKREKQIGLLKRKKPSYMEHAVKAAHSKTSKSQLNVDVMDVGPQADWVKINVQRTKDCFEVYALVPGLLREEVRVQSDPVGRLVISGEPEHPDNPWGVTPFRKVVSLPARIDPHQTSAVVTLHGQLFVRVPFEQSG